MKYKYKESITVEKDIELRECPFCGSNKVQPIHYQGTYGYSASEDYVKCHTCGATGPKVTDNDCGNHTLWAIDKWNNRDYNKET